MYPEPTAAYKSVLGQMQPLSLQQRRDVQVLVDQGMDPLTARTIVLGYSGVHKAKDVTPEYQGAYYRRAKKLLPANMHQNLMREARAAAGGHVAGKTRGKPETVLRKQKAEIERLQARIAELEGAVEKTSVSDVHVDVPLGSGKKKDPYLQAASELIAKKGDFDEAKHPRAKDGRFGEGSGNLDGQSKAKPSSLKLPQAPTTRYTPPAHSTLTPQERDHMDHYLALNQSTGMKMSNERPRMYHSFKDINEALRQDAAGKLTAKQKEHPMVKASLASGKAVDAIIDKTPLKKAEVFYRGGLLPAETKEGDVIATPGLTSASRSKDTATFYADKAQGVNKAVMTIKAPAKTPAFNVVDHYSGSWAPAMQEVIFKTRQGFKVTHDHGLDEYGIRHLDVEAVHAVKKKGEFDESQHPRDDHGRFGDAGGASGHPASDEHLLSIKSSDDPKFKALTAQDHVRGMQVTSERAMKLASPVPGEDKAAEMQRRKEMNDVSLFFHQHRVAAERKRIEAMGLTPDHVDAMREYKGVQSTSINNALEGVQRPHPLTGKTRKESPEDTAVSKEHGRLINEIVSKHTLNEPQTFYRGTHFPADAKVGDVVGSKRLTSVASQKDGSDDFTRNKAKSFLTISAPQGTHVVSVAKVLGWDKDDQYEHIFGSDQKFRITSVGKPNSKGGRAISMEAVPTQHVKKADFDESKHPRDAHGEFTDGAGNAIKPDKGVKYGDNPQVLPIRRQSMRAGRLASHEDFAKFTPKDSQRAASAHREVARVLNLRGQSDLAAKHTKSAESHEAKLGVPAAPPQQPQAQAQGLSQAHLAALRDYKSDDFFDINDAVSGHNPEGYSKALQSKLLAKGQLVNEAIAKSPLEHDATFHRQGEMPADLKPGDVYSSKRILSASSDAKTAHMFAGDEKAAITIQVPKGTPALNVQKVLPENEDNEKETIFASGQKFSVTAVDVDPKTGKRSVQMKAIAGAPQAAPAPKKEVAAPVAQGDFTMVEGKDGPEPKFIGDAEKVKLATDPMYENYTHQQHKAISMGMASQGGPYRRLKDAAKGDPKKEKAAYDALVAFNDIERSHSRANYDKMEAATGMRNGRGDRQILDSYVGNHATSISNMLEGSNRGDPVTGKREKLTSKEQAKYLEQGQRLNEIINHPGNALPEDRTFYRSTNFSAKAKVGDVISSERLISVAGNTDHLNIFHNDSKSTLTIKAPKGTQALSVARGFADFKPDGIDEHIFGSGQQFRITSVSEPNAKGGRDISMEAISDAAPAKRVKKNKDCILSHIFTSYDQLWQEAAYV